MIDILILMEMFYFTRERSDIMLISYSDVLCFFEERRKLGIKLGLRRVKILLDLLDNPEGSVPAIHVAGTNGKGSTIQFLQNSLRASGYRVGTYTSPSFTSIAGHFIVDGAEIAPDDTVQLLNKVMPAIKQLDETGDGPTEYEILTVMAFVYFSDHVDIALIETAMGGKDDTTNCFTPILSIITNVAMDHVQYLGATLASITEHKAGIIKPHVPVILGELEDTSKAIIMKRANSLGAQTYFLGSDFQVDISAALFTYKNKQHPLALRMHGIHQLKNASLAWMALYVLPSKAYKINVDQASKAINETSLIGRYEVISKEPRIVLDSAHNEAGIEALLQTIRRDEEAAEKAIMFAAFQDKDVSAMVGHLANEFDAVMVTTFKHPRAASVADLSDTIDARRVELVYNWQEKINAILKSPTKKTLYISGSMHFIMLVRKYILEKK